jgi:hypothetical protein
MAIGVQAEKTIEAQIIADIGTAVDAGNMRRAFDLANLALGRGVTNRIVFNARGLALQAAGTSKLWRISSVHSILRREIQLF